MNTEKEDYEEIDEEENEEIPKSKKIIKKSINKKEQVQEEKSPEVRYVAFRVQAQEGIMDTETNTPVGNEVYVILAEILNKLNNIEISQG